MGLGGEKALIFALSPANMDTGHWLIPFSMTIPHFDVLTNPIPSLRLVVRMPLLWKVGSRGRTFFFSITVTVDVNKVDSFPACPVNSNNTYLEDELG